MFLASRHSRAMPCAPPLRLSQRVLRRPIYLVNGVYGIGWLSLKAKRFVYATQMACGAGKHVQVYLAVVLADEAGCHRRSWCGFTKGYGFSRSPASVSTSQTFLISCRISAFMTAPAISGSIGCAESLFAGTALCAQPP